MDWYPQNCHALYPRDRTTSATSSQPRESEHVYPKIKSWVYATVAGLNYRQNTWNKWMHTVNETKSDKYIYIDIGLRCKLTAVYIGLYTVRSIQFNKLCQFLIFLTNLSFLIWMSLHGNWKQNVAHARIRLSCNGNIWRCIAVFRILMSLSQRACGHDALSDKLGTRVTDGTDDDSVCVCVCVCVCGGLTICYEARHVQPNTMKTPRRRRRRPTCRQSDERSVAFDDARAQTTVRAGVARNFRPYWVHIHRSAWGTEIPNSEIQERSPAIWWPGSLCPAEREAFLIFLPRDECTHMRSAMARCRSVRHMQIAETAELIDLASNYRGYTSVYHNAICYITVSATIRIKGTSLLNIILSSLAAEPIGQGGQSPACFLCPMGKQTCLP